MGNFSDWYFNKSDWQEKTLGEISTILSDGIHGTPIYDPEGDYFFINGNNLRNGKIVITPETKKVNFQEYSKYKKKFK